MLSLHQFEKFNCDVKYAAKCNFLLVANKYLTLVSSSFIFIDSYANPIHQQAILSTIVDLDKINNKVD